MYRGEKLQHRNLWGVVGNKECKGLACQCQQNLYMYIPVVLLFL